MDVLIGCTVVFAALFRGITGFGYSLIVVIVLASYLPPQTMIPLVLICDFFVTALVLLDRKNGAVDWKTTPMLLVCGFAGALCGGLLAGILDEETTKLFVALTVCVAASLAMIPSPPQWMAHKALGAVVAFLVGVLLAAFAVGGPLIAVWLLAGGTVRKTTRGTLAVFFGAVDFFGIMSRWMLDQVSSDVFDLLMLYLPLTFVGYIVGHVIGPQMKPLIWRRFSALGLIAIALISGGQTIMRVFFTSQ